MGIDRFIASNLELILSGWQDFADTCPPAAQRRSSRDLRDEAQAILCAIADGLAAPASRDGQGLQERSRSFVEAAQTHASARFASGFTLDQLLGEYRALRASVLSLWSQQKIDDGSHDLREVLRFDAAVDQMLTESVRWFSRRLEGARNLYVGILSHDLRDPLGAIAVSAEVVLADPTLREDHRRALVQIRRSSGRMSELIGTLLDLTRSRVESGIPISPGALDVRDVARRVVEELSAQYPERSIDLKVEGDLQGSWDGPRIQQVLSNLVANALRHGHTARPVVVGVRGEVEDVVITVHNFGPPVTDETLRAIREPLVQGPLLDGRSQTGKRVQLGLYIARQVIQAHGGSLTVASSEDAGTTFEVRLPRRVA